MRKAGCSVRLKHPFIRVLFRNRPRKKRRRDNSYYLQLGLAPNQTTANVDNGSELVAMYAALPAEGATYPTSGARMTLKKVTDEALLEELLKSTPQGFTPMYYEIVAVRSLG